MEASQSSHAGFWENYFACWATRENKLITG